MTVCRAGEVYGRADVGGKDEGVVVFVAIAGVGGQVGAAEVKDTDAEVASGNTTVVYRRTSVGGAGGSSGGGGGYSQGVAVPARAEE